MSLFNSIIHESLKQETTQMRTNWYRARQNVVYPYNGALLRKKRSELLIYITTWMNLNPREIKEGKCMRIHAIQLH